MQRRIQQLIEQVNQIIQVPPTQGTLPFRLQHKWAGFIWPPALKELTKQGYVHPHKDYIELSADANLTLSSKLKQIADVLHTSGCLPFWRNEQVHVWAEGEIIAHIERTATRPLGLLTQAVHLNAFSPDGQVYLALRSPTKQTDPGLWDTLVGGILNDQDSPEQGLVRESYEEAGLCTHDIQQRTPLRLITRMRRPLVEGYQVEDILSSECILDDSCMPQNIDGEVVEITRYAVSQVLDMMEQGMVTTEAMIVLLEAFLHNPLALAQR